MELRKKILKKLNSESGASLLYAIMLFMVATLVAVLILSSSVTALKRSRQQVESKQAELILDSAADLLNDYISKTDDGKTSGAMAYRKTTTTVTKITEVSYEWGRHSSTSEEVESTAYTRTLEISHLDQAYTSEKYITSTSECTVDKGGNAGDITYTAPSVDSELVIPQMLQNGILEGLLYVDSGASSTLDLSYKSEEHKANDGIIYMTLPYDSSKGSGTALNQAKAVKVTYVILPRTSESEIAANDGQTTDYEMVFTLTLEDTDDPGASSPEYTDTEYKKYLIVPISSIKDGETSTHTEEISNDRDWQKNTQVTRKTEIETTTVTWQTGTVSAADPLAE